MSEDLTGEIEKTPSHDVTVESSTTPEVAKEGDKKPEVDTSATDKPEVPKKSNKVQERINKLTREKHELRQTIGQADQKNAELETRIKALESKPAEVKETLTAPVEDSYETYSDYERANTDYIAKTAANAAVASVKAENSNRDAIAKEDARKAELDSKKASFDEQVDSKREHFEDFDDVAYGHAFMDIDLAEQIMDADKSPELAYHLGSHLDIAEKIFNMPPVQRARELTRLEISLEALAPKKVSDAPDPITPLGSSEVVEEDPDNMTADEWRTWRNKQVHG